jgi:hypothetical protein
MRGGRRDEGFGPENDRTVTHDRAVLLVKPDYFVVCDRLLPADEAEHTYDLLWHFGAGESAVQGRSITFRGDGAGLLLDTTLGVGSATPSQQAALPTLAPDLVQGREDPPQGWISYWYGQKQPAPTAIYHTRSTGALTFFTLLYPFPGDAAPTARLAEPPAAPQTNADADVQAVTVLHAEGRDLLLFSQAGAAVRCGDVETDAEAAGVRYGTDGTVKATFRVGGTYLRVIRDT